MQTRFVSRQAVIAVLLLLACFACADTGSSGGGGGNGGSQGEHAAASSCALAIKYRGVYYIAVAVPVTDLPGPYSRRESKWQARAGRHVGQAKFPLTCNDTGGTDAPVRMSKPFPVSEVIGVRPQDAVIGPLPGHDRQFAVYARPHVSPNVFECAAGVRPDEPIPTGQAGSANEHWRVSNHGRPPLTLCRGSHSSAG